MEKTYWIIAYLLVLTIDLFAVYSGNETIRYFSKPLLMPLLMGYFIFGTIGVSSRLNKWIILALIFSWAGDVLLMFESLKSNFFIFGLIAFLVAHVFYILFFYSVKLKEHLGTQWIFIPFIISYYVFLMIILHPHLGDMKWPVRIYGFVIMGMLYFAGNMRLIKTRSIGNLMVVGAFLFVISDSLLAINKFYNQFDFAGIAVMLTYAIAQMLLTIGGAKYITSISKQ